MEISYFRIRAYLHPFLCQISHRVANFLLHVLDLSQATSILFVKLFKGFPKPVAITRYNVTNPLVELDFLCRPSVLRHDE